MTPDRTAAWTAGLVVPSALHPATPVSAWWQLRTLPLLLAACAVLVLLSLWTLAAEGELSMGRRPWQNLQTTLSQMSEPSFLRVWFGNPNAQVRALSGFATVTQGTLRVLDTELGRVPRASALRRLRRRVALVHQGLHLVDRVSALDNVLVASAGRHGSPLTWIRHWPAAERRGALAALDRVGMGWAAARRTDSLSGGERQKVAIARAMHQDAPIVLADEPTASLDANAAEEIAGLLASVVAGRGATLICVVHDLDLIPRIAQRAIVLRHGRTVADVAVTSATPTRLRPLLQ